MQQQLVTTSARPSRAQIEPAALALLSRHSAGLLATARRYSATLEDAEDAYQRGVEILLTKAPTTTEQELLPWLKTVVKHEAFAVRKAGDRVHPAEHELTAGADADVRQWTDDQAERYERLRLGAEALAGLKPQEIRCLLLRAEGLSYNEICTATGWTYTKVNRCITEGRRAFMRRVAGIESGAECERLAPLISKVADGEATAEEMRAVRPHLKSCLACKATLREYRAAPSRSPAWCRRSSRSRAAAAASSRASWRASASRRPRRSRRSLPPQPCWPAAERRESTRSMTRPRCRRRRKPRRPRRSRRQRPSPIPS